MKEKILKLLKDNKDEFVSGETISHVVGISRAGIWKYINQLKVDGYLIESKSRNGYKLKEYADILNYSEIEPYLSTKFIGRNIFHFDTIDSTNTKAKELARGNATEGAVVISEEQTAGKGRLGRKWVSPKSQGIWMSIILRPNIDTLNASKLTLIGAAAVYKALESLNINSSIKWPNDIILNGKKLCGILTEMSGELNQIEYVIMGIGINVNSTLAHMPEDIASIATSLKIEKSEDYPRAELCAKILNNFELLYEKFILDENLEEVLNISREHSAILGKEIEILNRGKLVKAVAVDISSDGLLVLKHADGTLETVISGEVSLNSVYK